MSFSLIILSVSHLSKIVVFLIISHGTEALGIVLRFWHCSDASAHLPWIASQSPTFMANKPHLPYAPPLDFQRFNRPSYESSAKKQLFISPLSNGKKTSWHPGKKNTFPYSETPKKIHPPKQSTSWFLSHPPQSTQFWGRLGGRVEGMDPIQIRWSHPMILWSFELGSCLNTSYNSWIYYINAYNLLIPNRCLGRAQIVYESSTLESLWKIKVKKKNTGSLHTKE